MAFATSSAVTSKLVLYGTTPEIIGTLLIVMELTEPDDPPVNVIVPVAPTALSPGIAPAKIGAANELLNDPAARPFAGSSVSYHVFSRTL